MVDVGAGQKRRYKDWLTEFQGLCIHAIEPHPVLARQLRHLADELEKDDLTSKKRLKVHEFAATSKDGPCTFYLSNDQSSSSTLPFITDNIRKWRYPLGRRMFKTVDTIEIQGKTLETFCQQESIRGIAFLNIDVQGNTMGVLEGLTTADGWNRIKEINIKVHTIDWDLYEGQSVNYHVLDLCRRRYFSLQGRSTLSRGQEDVLCFSSDLAAMKGLTSRVGWSKRALMPMA
jgi:FkbM family methyltransferase